MGKQIVHTLVERGGKARSHHIANIGGKTLRPILVRNVSRKSNTNDRYRWRSICASARNLPAMKWSITAPPNTCAAMLHSNTAEGYFSFLKRGIVGVYHHVSEAHLKRYLAEFDFRYSERAALGIDDAVRAHRALKGIEGKRLTYRIPHEATNEKTAS